LPPFRLTFTDLKNKETTSDKPLLQVQPYKKINRGPYQSNQAKFNTIKFTPTQIEAIKSGMQPGLTIVIGPPGTGKTDVAVQIISNIYHNFPDQKTLIVTHSNQALNQLFEKIMALDIDERHLLRLGHGEESLETEKDFSRYGRVNYVLSKRLNLLDEVERLKNSLEDVQCDSAAYSCESAGHFFANFVQSRWQEYIEKIKELKQIDQIEAQFPFTSFFANASQPLFKKKTFEEDLEIARGCYRYISNIFKQLNEFRAFELIRNGADRAEYLLVKEAKIIAMTCTHAALKRRDLVKYNFKYDNILMEESAQILEIETFIPLLLQNPDHNGHNRLKRWIMIGDHHQLPPVIKNMTYQKYSNMEQSLFTRFVKLGIPTVDLDAQGRCRSSLCDLFKWRYKNLGSLEHVNAQTEFQQANAGFNYDYQLINVEDFNNQGESEPQPYFYQNLAEAEYAVALFMFMRLTGYPGEKISILTTYNGQKHLIRDVLKRRCSSNPLIGQPKKISTVDKYQGQQNDYIILSLVKTKNIGHLRDVRRLIVAMSRARLGLYVFARIKLFKSCYELTPVFSLLLKRPTKLHLVLDEIYPSKRNVNKPVVI
jgi:intron-binding protein aquarius